MNPKELTALPLEIRVLYDLCSHGRRAPGEWRWVAGRQPGDRVLLIDGAKLQGALWRKLLLQLFREGLIDRERAGFKKSLTAKELGQKSVVRYRLNSRGYKTLKELGL